jgi:hypothetical protein
VLEEAENMGLRDVEVVEMDMDPSVRGIVELCDPRDELNSESQFISFWRRARDAIDTFMSRHNHTYPTIEEDRHNTLLFRIPLSQSYINLSS